MIDVNLKNNCYGCGVCAISCPEKLIKIIKNKEGFYHPSIENINNCKKCGLCDIVCSYTDSNITYPVKIDPIAYASWSKYENVRQKCSSGGVGYEIGKYAISKKFFVCAVRYNPMEHIAEHFTTDNLLEFESSVGSKYIPSYTVNGFNLINIKEKNIVFGTPCQIDSLRRYLRKKKCEDNFILIDFFCHGVPSMNLWNKYRQQFNLPIEYNASWRNKIQSWHKSFIIILKYGHKKLITSNFKGGRIFYDFFLGDQCFGMACYTHCKYKLLSSAADIRIGDFWSKENKQNKEGISALVIFTNKGYKFINEIDSIIKIETPIDKITEGQMEKSPIILNRNKIIKSLQSNISLKYIWLKHVRFQQYKKSIVLRIKRIIRW